MAKTRAHKIRRNTVIAASVVAGLSYFLIISRMNTMHEEIKNLTIAVEEQIDISNMLLQYGTDDASQE